MTDLAKRFDAIIVDYEKALDTLAEVLQHIEETKPDARLRVVMLNNTIVALTATIEETMRGIFQEYLSILEECFDDHRELRQALQKANLDRAIQYLKKCKTDGDFKTSATVVSNLAVCLNGQPGYRLLKERIVYNQGNFRSPQVTEISKDVGFSDLWHSVCDCTEVDDYTGEAIMETRVTRLTSQWNEVFDERDLVVHRISQANGWAPERIQKSIDLSRLVVKRIAICLLKDAGELLANPRKAQ